MRKKENNEEQLNNQQDKKTKPKKKHKILKIILIIIIILLILGIAVFSAYLVKSKGNVTEAALDIVTDFVGEQDPIFCLILGVSEDISTDLTDTIILAGYNPQTQNAFMVSIPRDTYIGTNQVYANGYDKINSLYQKGCEKTVEAVEELTGVTIDYYVVVKNKALVDIVDAIGGVEFDVPIDMDYDDITQNLHIHLNAGMQTLNGDQAEQLVRFRHNNDGSSYPTSYGDNDYGRMKTQREFIKSLAKQLIRLDNVPKVKSIATAVFDNVDTDIELSKVLAYVPFGLEFNIENLTMQQLPGQSNLINELWFYVPNYKETANLFDELIEKLELDSEFESSHYKRITKSNIKIVNTNSTKKDNKTDNAISTKQDIIINDIKETSDEINEYQNTASIEDSSIVTNNIEINENNDIIQNEQNIEESPIDESETNNTTVKNESTSTDKTSNINNNSTNTIKTENKKNDSVTENSVKNTTDNNSSLTNTTEENKSENIVSTTEETKDLENIQ